MASIQGIYVALFGRPADPAGLRYFNEITADGADLSAVGLLTGSAEYTQRFANADPTARIMQIYRDLFGRDPDDVGLQFFVRLMNTGAASEQDIAIRILDGAQTTDQVTAKNRIEAANRFTASIDTPAEVAAYSGPAAIAFAQKLLSQVTANPASIPTVDAINGFMSALVSGTDPFAPNTPTPNPDPEPQPPKLNAISYGVTDGHLGIGETITFQLEFSENVAATAGTRLLLNNAGIASYTGGNGSNTLVFTYTVQAGDSIADLAMATTGALTGTIANATGTALAAADLNGLNPAGVVVVDGVQTTVSISASADGLRVTANKPGDVLIEDAGGTRFLLHAGNGADPVDTVIGQLAGGSVTGTVVVRSPSGNVGAESTGIVVAIGSSTGQNLSGQYVWGYGGDDIIDGTGGNDVLFGGDGNDTIRAGTGADVVYGGKGGNSIDLGADNDVDQVVYTGNEVTGLPFQDGDTTAHIDKISNVGVGDIIDFGRAFSSTPILGTTYLSGLNDNAIAVVRGSAAGGRFVQGDSAGDNDLMLQWITNGIVNSAILMDYGSRAEFVIDRAAGTLTLAPLTPAMSFISSATYSLLGTTSTATLFTNPDPVTHTPGSTSGFANRNGFSLLNYREFSPLPTDPAHTSGPLFGLRDNVITFNGPFQSNLYSLFWTNDAIDTTGGYLATGQIFFAGGRNNGFDTDGFAVAAMRTMSGNSVFTDAVPWAIFGHASGTASLMTGTGHDVVLSKGGALTIVYSTINASGEDLILDFDPAKDFIGLAGDLRAAVDDNGDGLDWMGGGGGQLVVSVAVDAVQVTLDGSTVVSSEPSLMQQTLATLNAALDVRQLVQGDDILILARHAQHTGSAALIYYRAEDDNGRIDANELTFIATFNGGAPSFVDIQLVGVPTP